MKEIKYLLLLLCCSLIVSCGAPGDGAGNKPVGEDTPQPKAPDLSNLTEMPITVLPSADERNINPAVSYDEYPYSISVNMDTFSSQSAIYGAVNQIWIGPKKWSGKGTIDGDGTVHVILHPAGDSSQSAPYITYTEVLSCRGCAVMAATSYFPQATDVYNKSHSGKPGKTIITGLKTENLSNNLIKYWFPIAEHLVAYGVAKYVSPDSVNNGYFINAQFVLPANDSFLADFFTRKFIEMRDLK